MKELNLKIFSIIIEKEKALFVVMSIIIVLCFLGIFNFLPVVKPFETMGHFNLYNLRLFNIVKVVYIVALSILLVSNILLLLATLPKFGNIKNTLFFKRMISILGLFLIVTIWSSILKERCFEEFLSSIKGSDEEVILFVQHNIIKKTYMISLVSLLISSVIFLTSFIFFRKKSRGL